MDKTDLDELLIQMVQSGATTLHLLAGQRPYMRAKGELISASAEPIAQSNLQELTHDFLFEDHRKRLIETGEVDVLYASRSGVRFRTSVMMQGEGLTLLFRRLPVITPTFEELSLPELFNCFTSFHNGLVVITGFFGSGKSTTLAALIDRLNRESACHIVTIEDPIEFIHGPGDALIHQREVGEHVQSVAEGIRQAARQGAEVIAVGEMFDHETLLAMLDASERGCLVLTTFGASSVVGALTKMVGLCPAEERARVRVRLAQAMRAMMTQTRLSKKGQAGRLPLFEVLINNPTVTRCLRAGSFQDLPEVMQRSRGLGMQTSDAGLRNLLSRGLINEEDALCHAVDWDYVSSRSSPIRIGARH